MDLFDAGAIGHQAVKNLEHVSVFTEGSDIVYSVGCEGRYIQTCHDMHGLLFLLQELLKPFV